MNSSRQSAFRSSNAPSRNSASASATDSPWLTADHTPCLQVALLKQTYVLPWDRFLFASGDPSRIGIVFATHRVQIQGRDLGDLLDAVTAKRLLSVREPMRTDLFRGPGEALPGIERVSVTPWPPLQPQQPNTDEDPEL